MMMMMNVINTLDKRGDSFALYTGATATPSVRLVGGSSDYEGRLQVFYDGVWSTVCDRYWTQHNSDVACRSAFGAG